ncbi:MAG: hypothetical protein ABFD59_00260 [Smithella sp.]
MAPLIEIEKLTKDLATARQVLTERVRTLDKEKQELLQRKLPGIKKAVNDVSEKQVALKAALEESKPLFEKPRTKVLHGIKIGFQKMKGKISWVDDLQVVKLIKKHLPEMADILIKTTEKPIKKALEQLSTADLKKIGVTVSDAGDHVVIKSTDDEIDKFVEALLKEDEGKEEEAA